MRGLDRNELINNTHYRVLFIRGIRKTVSRDDVSDALKKYGDIETFTLKTKIEGEKIVSRGIAIVQYNTKDQAANAMKNLPFETKLGDMIDVDFYQSKESRMVQLEQNQMNKNPMSQVLNPLAMTSIGGKINTASKSPSRA